MQPLISDAFTGLGFPGHTLLVLCENWGLNRQNSVWRLTMVQKLKGLYLHAITNYSWGLGFPSHVLDDIQASRRLSSHPQGRVVKLLWSEGVPHT